MSPRFLKYFIVITLLLLVLGSVALYLSLPGYQYSTTKIVQDNNWEAPDIYTLPVNDSGSLIRYGRKLIENTAAYFGPAGSISRAANGMNCQNCHLDAGTRLFGNPFALVHSSYPRFRERSGKLESVEFRINECMERSMNGDSINKNSLEMRAMVSYITWVGKDLEKGKRPPGTGISQLPYMDRAADPGKGYLIYKNRCFNCHGNNGEGQLRYDSAGYVYPPLWGNNSFNVSAGMYRITPLAAFIKYNMPYTKIAVGPQVSDEEAWDVAAYIISMQRPEKRFQKDWPNIAKKPVDHPFGPYTDQFSEQQHKYGPFKPIAAAKELKK